MRNRFKGKCLRCKKEVPEGSGFVQIAKKKNGGSEWLLRCRKCVGKGNETIK